MTFTGRRRLYLMRHGHVDYFAPGLTNFTQVPLTDEGCRQADETGRALSAVSFDKVFCSGLPRTVETARRVVAQSDTDSRHEPEAISAFEEVRGGRIVVPTREELAARLAYSYDAAMEPGATFLPGGELFADAYARVAAGLDRLIANWRWRTALLVAHDGINRLILGKVCGAGLAGMTHFEQDLACVNVLDFDVVPDGAGGVSVERVVIKAVNLTAYDPVKSALSRTSLEHLFDIDFGGARPREH